MQQGKLFYQQSKIETPCKNTWRWLRRLKTRRGLKQLKIFGDKKSADSDAAENFVEVFTEFIKNQNLTEEQIYNADETALYWKYVPRRTVATACKTRVSGFKDNKERVTLLG